MSRERRLPVGELAWIALAVLFLTSPAAAQTSHLLVIVGVSGDPELGSEYHKWASTLVDTARDRDKLAPESVIYLGEDPSRDPQRISGRSTREGITAAVDRLAARTHPGDTVFVVLIGHGATATGEPRFNIPGPDLAAKDYARLLDRFSGVRVVFVNTSSGSGAFLPVMAGRDRVVITATKNAGERNETRFPEFFVQALSSPEADLDKDGRISMLEAFVWARQRTIESYQKDGQLQTEHAVLDDDGDGKGAETPGQPPATEGSLARTLFLAGAGPAGAIPATADPAVRALYDQRKSLEDRIAALKAAKDRMDPAQYERELEQLLVELAKTSREIKAKEGK